VSCTRRFRGTLALSLAALSACSILEPRPDPTRYYLLTTAAKAPAAPTAARPESIGVGPITLPDYLERPEIVRRKAAHEIVPSPVERWAEPLAGLAGRVLGEDLALLTGADVVHYPWLAPAPQRQVLVSFIRFEPVEGARVELVARVRMVSFADNTATAESRQEITLPLAADDGATIAATMSEALLELARRIVAGAPSGGS